MKFSLAFTSTALAALPVTCLAQSIDMSQSRSAVVAPTERRQALVEIQNGPQHASLPVWTRVSMQPDALGRLHAVCAVEASPRLDRAHSPPTDQLPSQ